MKFDKVYLDENIFYIENFIDKKSLDILKKEIDENSFLAEEHEGLYHDVLWMDTKKSREIWDKISIRLNDLFSNDKEYLYNFPEKPFLIKYADRKGKKPSRWAMFPHSDKNEYDSDLTKGIVIYITDDYDGGELVYVNKDIKIKPSAGSLVCHPGSEEYTHGVKIFSGGPRIIISAFVHERKKPN